MGLNAPGLFAISQGHPPTKDEDRCHWCGGGCPRKWLHDDHGLLPHHVAPLEKDPASPHYRRRTTAFCPGNAYVCAGCYLFRRTRVTVNYLGGGLKDRQEYRHHSWWIDRAGAWSLRDESVEDALLKLLEPPHQFALSLISHQKENPVHLMVCNDLLEIGAGTPLVYTLDHRPMEYTIYELEEAMKHGAEGKSPGVRALFDFFRFSVAATNRDEGAHEAKKKRGRPPTRQPPDNSSIHRVVTFRSGGAAV